VCWKQKDCHEQSQNSERGWLGCFCYWKWFVLIFNPISFGMPLDIECMLGGRGKFARLLDGALNMQL